jgi:hypothetical protein
MLIATDVGEPHDLVESLGDIRRGHPVDRGVEEDILPTRRVLLKAGPEREKRHHPTHAHHAAFCGGRHAREDLE